MRTALTTSLSVCSLFLLVSACNGQKGGQTAPTIKAEDVVINEADTSLVAHLAAFDGDSVVMTNDYDGTNVALYYHDAVDGHHLVGDLRVGDSYAVTLDAATKRAGSFLNISQLSGRWIFDKDETSGIDVDPAGALSSINPGDYPFRKWQHHNGRLILYYIKKGSVANRTRDLLTDTTDIVSLGDERLVYRFRGETYACHRQKEEAIKVHFDF